MKNRNEKKEEDRKLFSYKINEKGKRKTAYILFIQYEGEVVFVLKHSVECNREGMNAFLLFIFPFLFTLFFGKINFSQKKILSRFSLHFLRFFPRIVFFIILFICLVSRKSVCATQQTYSAVQPRYNTEETIN